MQCPRCNVVLRQTHLREHGTMVLDTCETCNGAWFDQGELDRLDGSVWTNMEDHEFDGAEGDHPSVDCPKCSVPLTPLSPRGAQDLVVDRCSSCNGFWLDLGELDRIIDLAGAVDADFFNETTNTKPSSSSDPGQSD